MISLYLQKLIKNESSYVGVLLDKLSILGNKRWTYFFECPWFIFSEKTWILKLFAYHGFRMNLTRGKLIRYQKNIGRDESNERKDIFYVKKAIFKAKVEIESL